MKTMKNLKFLIVVLVTMFSLSTFADVKVHLIKKTDLTEIVKPQNVSVAVLANSFVIFELIKNPVRTNFVFTNSDKKFNADVVLRKAFCFKSDNYPIKDNYSQIKIFKSNYLVDKYKLLLCKGIRYNQIQCSFLVG